MDREGEWDRHAAPSLRGESGASPAGAESLAREVGDVLRQRGRVRLEHEEVDLSEDLLDPGGIQCLALGAHDLLSGRGLRPFVRVEEVLVELLPWPGADDLDRDVAFGLEA